MLTNGHIVSTDQIGRTVYIKKKPIRIISLVPSISELLIDLNLNNRLVGVTKFCIKPQELLKSKERIGGTKNLNIENIKKLEPDLIIANKEENVKEQIDLLSDYFPIWVSDVNTLNDALDMILEIGKITDSINESINIIDKINQEFLKLKHHIDNVEYFPISCIYFIWNKPFMIAGKDTFISDLLNHCNLLNVASINRYPEMDEIELKNINPEIMLLSSEPYPFKEKHVQYFKKKFPNTNIALVDGEMFSWYGSHLIKAPNYFISLLKQLNIKNHL